MYANVYWTRCAALAQKVVVKLMSKTIGYKVNKFSRHANVQEVEYAFGDEDEDEIDAGAMESLGREARTQAAAHGLELAPKIHQSEIFRAEEGSTYNAYGLQSGTIYGAIFMDKAQGKQLSEIMTGYRRANYSSYREEDKRAVLTKLNMIAPAISKLHAAGIIHNDLSFDNVYLDEKKNIVTLIDFGKARDGQPAMPSQEYIFSLHCREFFKLVEVGQFNSHTVIGENDKTPEYAKCADLASGNTVDP